MSTRATARSALGVRLPRFVLLKSVKGGLIAGFGLLALVLTVVVAGSAWLVREYQTDTARMAEKADTALLIQGAESHVGTAGLMLQRFAIDGDPAWVPEIVSSADSAGQNLTAVAEREAADNDTQDLARLQEIDVVGGELRTSLEQVIALRTSGDAAGAAATLDGMVGPFRQYRADLRAAADDELAEVESLRAEVERTGDLAFWLLMTGGVLGIALGATVFLVIARSIIRPLSSLVVTAKTVAVGDMSARAPVSGPRELAKVGEALNQMMTTVEERTEELHLSNEELRERNRQLLEARALAAIDALTGLLNHRRFHQKVREVIAQTGETGGPVGLIMLDVDNFKQVNDTLGHLKGDEVLRDLAITIVDIVGQDHGYRYGGDEFAILLPGYNHKKTTRAAQRVLYAVTNRKDRDQVTVSMGVAAYPEVAASAEELVYRADMALNWAKSCGKNRVGDWHSLLGSRANGDATVPVANEVDTGLAAG